MIERSAIPRARRAETLEAEAARHPYLASLLGQPFTGWLGRTLDRPMALTDAVVADLRGVYLGLVAEVDRQIGRVLGALAASGELERTLVIVTADHGEMLGDGWQLGKQGFRPEAFHVPLIIRHPAQRADGRVVDAFTEHVDLVPTILDATDITIPRQCDGYSLLPFLAGETPRGWRDAAVYEHDFRDLETGRHRTDLGLEDDACGILVRRSKDRLYAQFAGLPALCWAIDGQRKITEITDPAIRLAEAEALLRHRMAKTERRLTGCLLTPDGIVGGYDPL
jgi:arylsulfatase A-like enzyme